MPKQHLEAALVPAAFLYVQQTAKKMPFLTPNIPEWAAPKDRSSHQSPKGKREGSKKYGEDCRLSSRRQASPGVQLVLNVLRQGDAGSYGRSSPVTSLHKCMQRDLNCLGQVIHFRVRQPNQGKEACTGMSRQLSVTNADLNTESHGPVQVEGAIHILPCTTYKQQTACFMGSPAASMAAKRRLDSPCGSCSESSSVARAKD